MLLLRRGEHLDLDRAARLAIMLGRLGWRFRSHLVRQLLASKPNRGEEAVCVTLFRITDDSTLMNEHGSGGLLVFA